MAKQDVEKQGAGLAVANVSPEVQNMLALLNEAKVVKELTSEYLTPEDQFELGEEKRFIFTGMRKIAAMEAGKERSDAVCLMDATGKSWITAAAVVVGSCIDLKPFTAVSLVYKGKEVGKNKMKYDAFDVTELDLRAV